MCGILGMIASAPVATDLVAGLLALQHRGQDAAGVVTLSDRFHTRKGAGLVREVFHDGDAILALHGRAGIGHVRYATQGTTDAFDAQPFAVNYPFGIAMAHNGNVTNFDRLRQRLNTEHHRLIETHNDVELILYTLAAGLERRGLDHLDGAALLDAVDAVHAQVEGAYAVVALVAGKGLVGFRDRHGIRPLALGRRDRGGATEWALASETTCFDALGFTLVREVEPGEAVLIGFDGSLRSSGTSKAPPAFCAFEFVYFAREDAVMNGRLVADARLQCGRRLAARVREQGLRPDIVIDVPSSAFFAASGLAEALDVPYRRGLAKNNHVGRSFLVATQTGRERLVRQKLNPIRAVIEGQRVAVVDDSIVRGTTSRHIVGQLRDAGAREVYFISAAPPVRHRCVYGIDLATRREILAADGDVLAVRAAIGADAVVYQSLDDLRGALGGAAGCYACFSGDYPTAVSEADLARIEAERARNGDGDVAAGAAAPARLLAR